MGARRGPRAKDGPFAVSPIGSRRGPRAKDGPFAVSPIGDVLGGTSGARVRGAGGGEGVGGGGGPGRALWRFRGKERFWGGRQGHGSGGRGPYRKPCAFRLFV